MTTVYLHIGTAKTGTTSIQNFLAENRILLEKQDFSYPYMNLGLSHQVDKRNAHFLAYLSPEKDRAKEKEIRSKGYEFVSQAAREHSKVILSDELIWSRSAVMKNFWPQLAANFKRLDCKVKVIVYLRRQDQLLQSLWNQYVKDFRIVSQTFLEYSRQNGLNRYPFDYFKHLNTIAKAVGKENLIVRVYEKSQFKDNNLISDFLQIVGVSHTDEFTSGSIHINHGLSGNFIEMKRIINKARCYKDSDNFLQYPMLFASVQQQEISKSSKASMFTYEETLEYLQQYEESNRKVAEVYLNRPEGELFRDKIEDTPVWQLDRDTLHEDILLFTTEALFAQETKIRELQSQISDMRQNMTAMKQEIQVLRQKNTSMYNSLIFRIYRKLRRVLKHK